MGYNILQSKALQQYNSLQHLEPSLHKYYEPYGFNDSPPEKRKPEPLLPKHWPLLFELKKQQQPTTAVVCIHHSNWPELN